MAVLIFLGCLLGGIAIGLPIAWALLLCGAALMFWLDMFDVQIMAQTLVNGADSFSLLAIPFFVLAGEIMNAGGLSKRIVDLPMKLVGHKPGGLGYVGVLAAMIMAGLWPAMSITGKTTLSTTVLICVDAVVQVLSTADATSPLPAAEATVANSRQSSAQKTSSFPRFRIFIINYSPFHSVYYLRRFQRIIHQ